MPRRLKAVTATCALLLALSAAGAQAFQWHRVAIGRRVRCLPVAYSRADRARGLQGVARVARPLVFAFSPPVMAWFWMKDTPVPLTGVWVGVAGSVIGYWHGRPYSTTFHASPAAVSAVIEYSAAARVPPRGARVTIGRGCPLEPGGL